MNEQSVLATAMLAISFSALLLLMGLEQGAKRDRDSSVALTRQADVREGLDIRLVSERSPYMRSER